MPEWKIDEVSWTSLPYTKRPIRGVLVNFHGFGLTSVRFGPSNIDWTELELAERGVLNLLPYLGPWIWMNRQSRAFMDEYLDRVYREFAVPAETPLVISGGSMGGLAAVIYTRYTRRRIAACAPLMGCYDLLEHYARSADVRASIHCTFRGYPESLEECLREHSPLHQVEHLPDIPYFMMHGALDDVVPPARHSEKMVAAMRARGLNVEYILAPDVPHNVTPPYARRRTAFILRVLGL